MPSKKTGRIHDRTLRHSATGTIGMAEVLRPKTLAWLRELFDALYAQRDKTEQLDLPSLTVEAQQGLWASFLSYYQRGRERDEGYDAKNQAILYLAGVLEAMRAEHWGKIQGRMDFAKTPLGKLEVAAVEIFPGA